MLVFLSPFKKAYYSELFSLSSLLALIFLVAAILLPLFLGYATEDFWVRLKEYSQQPIVDFPSNKHYMLYITNFNDSGGEVLNFFDCSESSNLTDLKEKFYEICENVLNDCVRNLTTYFSGNKINIDSDSNDLPDKLEAKYVINGISEFSQKYLDLKFMFFIKYGLNKKVKLIMTPMIYINIPLILDENNRKGKHFHLVGEIKLNQKSPIATNTITNRAYDYDNDNENDEDKGERRDNPFFLNDYEKEKHPFDLLQYYNKYKNMNLTVKYEYEMVEKDTDDASLELNIKMIVPKLQNVFYVQGIFETIKYAWMQYFYIFIPIYIILYFFIRFIIENNIFSAKIKSDLN